jgi:hypothetical protein
MPWYFRKSIGLGRGARMAFSKSGVSYSLGGKGYRLTTGPHGTYVTLGAGGVYYRQRVGGPYGTSAAPSSPATPRLATSWAGRQTVETASVDQLVDASSAAVIEQINRTVRAPRHTGLVVALGVVFTVLLAVAVPALFPTFPWFLFMVLAAIGWIAYLTHEGDRCRCTYPLFYEMDRAASARWDEINAVLSSLARAGRLWRLTTLSPTFDWKNHAGANTLVDRRAVVLSSQVPPGIATNLQPFCLDIDRQHLYFMPDRLYVYEGGRYGAVEYDSLSIDAGATTFREHDPPPADAVQIGATWLHPNKDGSPDRRYSYNREIPILQYGVVQLRSSSGLNLLLYVSSLDLATGFPSAFRRAVAPQRAAAPTGPGATSAGQHRAGVPPSQGRSASGPGARHASGGSQQRGSGVGDRQQARAGAAPPNAQRWLCPNCRSDNSSHSARCTRCGFNPSDRARDSEQAHHQAGSQRQSGRESPGGGSQQHSHAGPGATRPATDCYRILGLVATCTREAAIAAYHELVRGYHPDRVAHLAPEFRALAEKRMKEINAAYATLKRLRGW